MKKTIFALAAFAALAMGCVKEQQPSDTPADQGKVTTIRVTVAQTKVAVDETTGACTWQEGDQLAVWYQNDEDNTAGKKVIFTYKGLLEDGSAEFITTEGVAGYTAVRAAHPVSSVTETGFSLTRDWTYDAERRPLYVRAESITTNPDGSLSAQLGHNASLFKFTLHDIPAYAAGFVLETKRYNEDGTFKDQIDIKTSFPYKTGYTADPADNSNDIDLYSVAPHSSYLSRIYLIDGDGEEIEGSEKKFKQSDNAVSNHDFIALPRVDFQKANLRKDYVKVCGIKWAKGNLQYLEGESIEGFQSGYRIAPAQWHYFNYDKSTDPSPNRVDVSHSSTQFDHFNFCGIESPWTCDVTKYAAPATYTNGEYAISDIMYTDQACTKTTTDYSAAKYGDIARWATMNTYRMPTSANLKDLRNIPDIQYGYYLVDNTYYVWGILFTDSLDETQDVSGDPVAFTDADMECGLFLPFAGRRADASDNKVINTCMQGAYWSSMAKDKSVHETFKNYSYEYSTIIQLNKSAKRDDAVKYGYTQGERWNRQNGMCVRPIYRGE